MVAGTRKALPSLAEFLNPHTLAAVFGMVGEDSGDDTLVAFKNLTGFVLVDSELLQEKSEGFRNGDEYEDNMTSGPSSPLPRTTKQARLE
jgi:hypothetical protein